MIYVVWAAALFFAVSWTLGIAVRPDFRLKSTIVTLVLWWAAIGLAAVTFSAWHLLWLMPLAVFVPASIMQSMLASAGRVEISGVLKNSLVWFVPIFAALLYFWYKAT